MVILGDGGTALAVARSIAALGSRPVVVSGKAADVCRFSRACDWVRLEPATRSLRTLLKVLPERIWQAPGGRPVLIPTSDELALFVARRRDRLSEHFRVWTNRYEALETLVSKDRLYAEAARHGIPTPRLIVRPTIAQLQEWLRAARPPFIVKPLYPATPGAPFRQKNAIFESAAELDRFCEGLPNDEIVVQEFRRGGDGNVYDCYGLCRADGAVVVAETHRRIRQWSVDRGVTSYGEIPATGMPIPALELVANTKALFAALPYHGIFGVEWLWDEQDRALFLLDVNARPFSSIGHLRDAGLNLPALAVEELVHGPGFEPVERAPTRHTYWIDLGPDLRSALTHVRQGRLGALEWCRQLRKVSSHCYWSWRDPLPAVATIPRETFRIARSLAAEAKRSLGSR